MRRLVLGATLVAIVGLLVGCQSGADPARLVEPETPSSSSPNILWIVAEDHSPDLGSYGDGYAITPNLDRLATDLGWPSASGAAVTINAFEPGTEYGERVNQFDLRFTKIIPIDNARLRAMFDIYNVFYENAVFSESYAQGNYLTPLGFMPPRLLRFSFQYDF